jgi:hypothetical protein
MNQRSSICSMTEHGRKLKQEKVGHISKRSRLECIAGMSKDKARCLESQMTNRHHATRRRSVIRKSRHRAISSNTSVHGLSYTPPYFQRHIQVQAEVGIQDSSETRSSPITMCLSNSMTPGPIRHRASWDQSNGSCCFS